ncbi:MAG: pyrroline-5-carboxylate reductase [Actinomycetaceae bacterium]|nr:pyrroline-5-carboxylate reductase [Actinomycetaceae bacterium]
MTQTLGLIGCGNMGGAIVSGAVDDGIIKGKDIYLYDLNNDAATTLAKKLGAKACASVGELMEHSHIVILGVKPHQQKAVIDAGGDYLESCDIFVSIAAGISTATIASYHNVLANKPIVRVMPNVNALIGKSVSGICANSVASQDDIDAVQQIFDAVGTTHRIPEEYFGVFAALAGCSPAWTYTYIDALAQAAVAHGLPKAQAVAIVAATVEGSAQLMLHEAQENNTVPQVLVDRVCSPGGTTVAGLLAAEDKGMSAAIRAAVNAAVKRDGELSGS